MKDWHLAHPCPIPAEHLRGRRMDRQTMAQRNAAITRLFTSKPYTADQLADAFQASLRTVSNALRQQGVQFDRRDGALRTGDRNRLLDYPKDRLDA